ncbi:MAG: hypothetical protein H0V53_00100 [Rubrobacter sp.]|nr:hypothetical protein [Rubrobacter sp.]
MDRDTRTRYPHAEELLSPVVAEALVPRTIELGDVLPELNSPIHKAFEQFESSLSATVAGGVAGLMSGWAVDLTHLNESGRPPIVDVAQSFSRSPLSGLFGAGVRVGGSVGGRVGGEMSRLSGALSGPGTAWGLGGTVSGLSGVISQMPGVEQGVFGLTQRFSLEALGVPEEVREFLSALRAYEEGDCAPLFEFARRRFGTKLDRRRRKRLQREVPWIWELSPGEGLVLLRHPERWLDEQALGRRKAAINRVLRKYLVSYTRGMTGNDSHSTSDQT